MNLVEEKLLQNNDLDLSKVKILLSSLNSTNLDYGEIFLQSKETEIWSLEESKVKSSSYSKEAGVGIRAIVDDKTGFAYSDEISLQAIKNSCDTAKNISHLGQKKAIKINNQQKIKAVYSNSNPIDQMSVYDKIDLLHSIDQNIRNQNKYVSQVFANLVASHELVLILATDGTFATDIRPLVRLNVSVVIEKNSKREQGSSGMGGRYDFSCINKEKITDLENEALRLAILNLEAKPAPAGSMDVVLGAGWPGVLLHEAVGHGLEADFIRKKTSIFSDKLGKKVASNLCTVIDDGTLENRRGSLSVDDEGTKTKRNVLIENGILTGFMQDKLNARLMNKKPTGNGRRESYAYLPMPRMTNTFMLNGESNQKEMIEQVKNGIFAVNFGGGQVDITSGKFVFVTSEAYKIENGKITYPIKNATLIGNGPEVMQKIKMVGDNLKLDQGVGTCGKDGQSVPVGVGQPSLLVNDLIVGGTDNG